MSQTQVVVEESCQTEQAKYEEILTRFVSSTPTDRVNIEQSLVETFERSIERSKLNEDDNKASEMLADRITTISTILSTVASASSVANQTGLDLREVIVNGAQNLIQHSTMWFGTALGLTSTLSLVIAVWNVKRVAQTGQKVQSAHEDFVQWDRRFMDALQTAETAVDRAVEDLLEYFVRREALLRVQDGTQTGVLEYEMGMQMARCMAAVEHKLERFKTLIDKAESTLAVIEANVDVLEETASRQKRRGWMTVASGAVTFVAGIATCVASGGVFPIVVAVLGVAVAGAGGCVVYFSRQQLEKLQEIRKDIGKAKKQLNDYRASCEEFEQRVIKKIQEAKEYITEAQKEAQLIEEREKREALERKLREFEGQNNALEARFGSQSADQQAILTVLARYRLEKCLHMVLDMDVECVDDLEYIDEDTLAGVDCKPIVKKKLLRMVAELKANK